jgi:hypothetical protein
VSEERPQLVVNSHWGELTVGTQAPSYPHQVDLDIKGSQPIEVDGHRFDSFTAYFSLSEGSLRAKSVYVYQRGPKGLSHASLPTPIRKKIQAELKKALLAQRHDLVQLEMQVLEHIEARLARQKQTLVNLGAVPSPEIAEPEASALGELLNSTLAG